MRFSKYLFLLMFAGMALSAFAQAPTPPADAAKGYTLGPGDEVTGKVLGEPQFDFVATVDADGKLEVPFVDKPLMAKCKTESDLRAEVTEALKKFLRAPQVRL